MPEKRKTGQTRDSAFQVGVRRSFDIGTVEAWEWMMSEEGVNTWLGNVNPEHLHEGRSFETEGGLKCAIQVVEPNSHIRLTYKPETWENATLLQVRVIRRDRKTSISFHQDQMKNDEQREEMKQYWHDVLDKIETKLK